MEFRGGVFLERGGQFRRVQWLGLSVTVVGTWVSVESHNLGPQSLHWPECLSGPPQTACGAGGRSNRDRGSSYFAFSSFCGSRDPLPLGVSEIAAGSERETHLFSFRRLCCYYCWQPLPWL